MAELLAATYCILALGHQENIEEQETIVLVDDHDLSGGLKFHINAADNNQ
jgi:hypothetical protein